MTQRLGFWIAHFCVLGICAPLAGGFVVQFLEGEFPCPLCLLQRMGMMLCGLGPAYVILRARTGEIGAADFATGYGMSVVGAVAGASVSARQILLHIGPADPGFGAPVLGLHLYTWAFVVFVVVLAVAGLNLIFTQALAPGPATFGLASKLVVGLFGAIILANVVAAFLLEGLHFALPGTPERYELLYDLGLSK